MFVDAMRDTLTPDEEFNVSVTEKGALGYRTTGKALLDLNFKLPVYAEPMKQKLLTYL